MPTYPNKDGFYRDGKYRKNVIVVSTASSRYNVPEEESGSLFFLDTASTMNFILPKASSKWLGLEYTFYISTQASSLDVHVRVDVNDSSALIRTGFSSIVDRETSVSPGTTGITAGKFTAVSSIMWLLEQISMGYSHTSDATSNFAGWTTA